MVAQLGSHVLVGSSPFLIEGAGSVVLTAYGPGDLLMAYNDLTSGEDGPSEAPHCDFLNRWALLIDASNAAPNTERL